MAWLLMYCRVSIQMVIFVPIMLAYYFLIGFVWAAALDQQTWSLTLLPPAHHINSHQADKSASAQQGSLDTNFMSCTHQDF